MIELSKFCVALYDAMQAATSLREGHLVPRDLSAADHRSDEEWAAEVVLLMAARTNRFRACLDFVWEHQASVQLARTAMTPSECAEMFLNPIAEE